MAETARKTTNKNKWKTLRLSLKYRPKLMQLILKMRQMIRRRNLEIKSLKHRLERDATPKLSDEKACKTDVATPKLSDEKACKTDVVSKPKEFNDSSTQTLKSLHSKSGTRKLSQNALDEKIDQDADNLEKQSLKNTDHLKNVWKCGDSEKSIAEQVKEAALNTLTEFEIKSGWNLNDNGDKEKSIADQVKEVAQSAMQQSGMVYVESAGMYYDYKTGYYYNSELGLYYHTDTNCYYYYCEEKQQFQFHSYPDTSAVNANLLAHQKKKARKQLKRERNKEDIEHLTKTLSQDNEDTKKSKRRKIKKSKKNVPTETGNKDGKKNELTEAENKDGKKNEPTEAGNKNDKKNEPTVEGIKDDKKNELSEEGNKDENIEDNTKDKIESANKLENNEGSLKETTSEVSEEKKEDGELEDGECSDTASDDDDSSSNASTASVDDEDAIAKHHPPCMRVIVRETDLPKLKVGTLFFITKDGGTIGREGEQHAILIKDNNVSRNHLDVRYDMQRSVYVATDLGSKNGTVLNGNRMSESAEISHPMDILHGSTIQLGETKLLCHIHPGNDTCGHCEPGLIMETEEKEKKAAYTRTCSVKKQHELELARLKNIYAPQLLAIEEKPYNDRAQARRETVGSSHHSAKTESTSLDTSISTENKGFKLLQKMGWSKGEGLGKDSQGDTEPVPLVSNEGKAGLGTSGAVSAPPLVSKPRPKSTIASATMRLAARTKMLQPPAKAFQAEDEDDDLDE